MLLSNIHTLLGGKRPQTRLALPGVFLLRKVSGYHHTHQQGFALHPVGLCPTPTGTFSPLPLDEDLRPSTLLDIAAHVSP